MTVVTRTGGGWLRREREVFFISYMSRSYMWRVGEILPGAFCFFFCEVAVEDDPAVVQGVGMAGFEEPVAIFGG